jgi:hypothetical protein
VGEMAGDLHPWWWGHRTYGWKRSWWQGFVEHLFHVRKDKLGFPKHIQGKILEKKFFWGCIALSEFPYRNWQGSDGKDQRGAELPPAPLSSLLWTYGKSPSFLFGHMNVHLCGSQ